MGGRGDINNRPTCYPWEEINSLFYLMIKKLMEVITCSWGRIKLLALCTQYLFVLFSSSYYFIKINNNIIFFVSFFLT